MLVGCENLAKHIDTVQQFGLPYIVAINEFATDTPAEVAALEKWCEENNHPMSLSQVWAKGGEGAIDLANKVVALCDQENNYAPLYDLDKSIEEKVETIAKKVYGADGVDFTEEAQAQIAKFNELGWDKLPICMAKTQMSLSDDGKVMGRPTGFRITVRELRPSLGAGFIVALTGKVLTMPGLPKVPAAEKIDVSRQTISNWENEKSYPDIISVIALSDLYSVSLDELLKGDQKMAEHLEESTNVVKSNKKLTGAILLNIILMILLIALNMLLPEGTYYLVIVFCGNHEFIGIALSDYQTDLGGRLLWDGIK